MPLFDTSRVFLEKLSISENTQMNSNNWSIFVFDFIQQSHARVIDGVHCLCGPGSGTVENKIALVENEVSFSLT